MSNTLKTLSVSLIIAVVIFSCQKKADTPTPDPVAAATGSTPHLNKVIAKVNNIDWTVYCTSDASCAITVSKFGTSYLLLGQSSFTAPYSSLSLNFTYTTGILTLGQVSNKAGHFVDPNAINFTAKTGTINITTMDTLAGGVLNKFAATFSFKTDTIGGVSKQITNGVIDYIKP